MIPSFHENDAVIFTHSIHTRSIPSMGGNVIIVNQNAKGFVSDYNQKGTTNNPEDDFVGIEIESGDEAVGKVVWVPSEEFMNLKKVGYK